MGKRNAWLVLIAILFVCCHPDLLIHSYQPIQQQTWSNRDTVHFSLNSLPQDTCRLAVEMRLKNNFQFKSIWVAVEQRQDSTGSVRRDTLCCTLRASDSKMMDKGNSFLQYESAPIPLYIKDGRQAELLIYHLMEREDITGVSDVGICVKR